MRGRTAAVLGLVIDDAREEVAELVARYAPTGWLPPADPWALTDAEVVDLIDTWYPGGWLGFLRDSAV